MKLQLFHKSEPLEVEIEGSGEARAISIGGSKTEVVPITLGRSDGTLRLNGRAARFLYERAGTRIRIAVGGECFEFDLDADIRSKRAGVAHGNPETRAPMPGKVLEVVATVGREVNAGDPLMILEAMKMENVLSAEIGGTVKEVHVKAGDMVEPGKLLVLLEPKV